MGSGCGIRSDNKRGGRETFQVYRGEVHPTGWLVARAPEYAASGCFKSLKVKVNHGLPPGIVISKYQVDTSLDTSQVSSLGRDAVQDNPQNTKREMSPVIDSQIKIQSQCFNLS